MRDKGPEHIFVPMGDLKSKDNPIMVGLQENRSMGVLRYDVILQVGNYHNREEADMAAQKIIKLVEKKLGSRSIYGSRQ